MHSPVRSLCEVFQGHVGPGLRRLQAHTQDVDTQQGAGGQHAQHQPPLERHPTSRCVRAAGCVSSPCPQLLLQEHEETEDGEARRQARMLPPPTGQFSLEFLVELGRKAREVCGAGGGSVNVGI